MNIEPARRLSDAEMVVLRLLLQPDFDGVEQLRAQAEGARATWRCDCGCPTIHIDVAEDAPVAALRGRLSPVELRVDPEADNPVGDIILFLRDGRLSSMEYVWYTDRPPDEWPTAERLALVTVPR